MEIVTYRSERGPRAGVLTEAGIVDVWDSIDAEPAPEAEIANWAQPGGVRSLLQTIDVRELAAMLEAGGPVSELNEAELLPPVPDPQKLICIGLNYRAHAAEAAQDPPPVPTFFAKFANALRPDGATVTLPEASRKVDFEAEVAFVVGRQARRIDPAEALEHIAGYTLLNDLSARDLQFATPQWIPGKVFDGSAPCGPALITADQIDDPAAIGVALDLNGERMQEATTADLIFSIPELLAHLSTLMTLEPGDIISTGTPAGVGSTRDPRVWLQEGDELVVSSPQLGELRTTIAR